MSYLKNIKVRGVSVIGDCPICDYKNIGFNIKFYLNKKNILVYSLKDIDGKNYREEELGCLKANEKDDFIKFIK